MRCFYHPDRDAVAVCKSCSRGICPECCADVPPGVACRSKCEDDVAALNLILQRGKTAYQKTGAVYRRNGVVLLICGLLFGGFGLLSMLASRSYGALFSMPLGAVFLLWSFLNFYSGKQFVEVGYGSSRGVSPCGGPARPADSESAATGPPSAS